MGPLAVSGQGTAGGGKSDDDAQLDADGDAERGGDAVWFEGQITDPSVATERGPTVAG
jgi:hypothetical protein